MNLFAILPLITDFILFCVGILVFLKNRTSKLNILFSLLSFSLTIWLFGYTNMYLTKDAFLALRWARIGFLGIIFIPIFTYHFIVSFLNLKRKIVLPIIYLLAIPSLILSQTSYIYSGIKEHFWGYYPTAGKIYIVFLSMFGILLSKGAFLLFIHLKKESGIRREQIKYLCLAFVIGTCGIVDYVIKYPIFDIYPFGYACALLFNSLIAFAIVRYRLMDIKIVITRTGIFIVVYTIVLGLPFVAGGCLKGWLSAIFGMHWWTLPLSLMAVLATLGPFLYIFLERKAEEQLLKEQKNYQRTLRQASMGMTRIRDLRRLLELIAHIVTKSVGIAYVGIYLHNKESGDYVLQVSRDKGRESILKLGCDNSLIAWITLKHQPLIYEEVKRLMEETGSAAYKSLEENMRLLTAAVVIPSFLEDRFMGFIVLGEKISGQIYTADDLNVFQVLANQAALAIENAQFYDQTKQMHVQIAQAEKMATIGTMADGLSHQINNRFYALSLIAEDTIDNIKCTDTSQCSAEIKEMIEEINYALGRIKQNVLQGGQVVKGILKYTRKGEEKFEPVTLDQIIDGTLEMVQYKIKLSEIDIIRNYDSNLLPKIKANLIQMQESWFNLIDNAYDATVERKTKSEEEGYRGKIEFSALVKEEGIIEIKITDNGMGVKQENLKKLFTPFFTTKVSSRQGTGLGLYVIKRIIEENHHGKVRIESEHGKGTTFFIELYIWQGEQDGMKDETKR